MPNHKISPLRLVASDGVAVTPPDTGPRLQPEAVEALRQLCDLARAVARDELLLGGLRADEALAGAVLRLAEFDAS